jgi:protein gp37
MGSKTNISWCDSTINFWSGCTKVSPGCKNCYAEARDKRHMQESVDHWGKGAPRLKHVGAFRRYLKDKKGRDPSEWPKDLRVREFPTI